MPSTGGRGEYGGDDTGHAAGGGAAAGSAGGSPGGGKANTSVGIGFFGPMGLRGYKKSGNKVTFSHPTTWSEAEREAARGSYTKSREPQGFVNNMMATLFGYPAMPPYIDINKTKPADAVKAFMDYQNKKSGILGRLSPTKPGVATDLGLTALGALSGPIAPGPVVGGLAGLVNVIDNYGKQKEEAKGKLSDYGYTAKDIDAAFDDYESGLVEGLGALDGTGGGEGNNSLSEYEVALAKGLKEQREGNTTMKTSTSQKSNVEEMRAARRKKTQRVFGGKLGSTDSGNRVKRAELLGQ
jgi:hypothetical protein